MKGGLRRIQEVSYRVEERKTGSNRNDRLKPSPTNRAMRLPDNDDMGQTLNDNVMNLDKLSSA